MKKGVEKRKFLGKVGNKVQDFMDKQEMDYEKKHLKAYLKGRTKFIIGRQTNSITGLREIVYGDVKQEFINI